MQLVLRRIESPGLATAACLAAAVAGAAAATLRDPFLVAAALVALAYAVLAFRNLAGAIAAFVACTFVEQLPGTGSGVTLVKGMGAVVALAWIVGLARGEISARALGGGRTAIVVGAGGLFAWSLLSVGWASDPRAALDSALRLGQGVVLMLVLVTTLTSRRRIRMGMLGFVAGAVLSAALGLAGVGTAEAAAAAAAGTPVRIGGGLADPNYLAAVLVPGIVFALAARPSFSARWARLLLLAAPVPMLLALLKTESRGGLVALAASILAGLVVGGRLRRQLLGAAAAAVAIGGAYLGLASSSAFRLFSIGGTGSGRTELWSIAFQAFRAHPLAGVGAGNFPVVEPIYTVTSNTTITKPYLEVTLQEVAHNTYLHVLAELGLVGEALLALLVVGALLLALRAAVASRGDDPSLELLARGLVVGGIGMFVAFAFLTAQYEKQLWIVLGLLGAAAATRALARAPQSLPPAPALAPATAEDAP